MTMLAVAVDQWSYYPWVAKVPNVNTLADAMNLLGADGWELVTSVTTVKSWLNLTGNDLVFVFKKPGGGHHPTRAQLVTLSGMLAGVDPDVVY